MPFFKRGWRMVHSLTHAVFQAAMTNGSLVNACRFSKRLCRMNPKLMHAVFPSGVEERFTGSRMPFVPSGIMYSSQGFLAVHWNSCAALSAGSQMNSCRFSKQRYIMIFNFSKLLLFWTYKQITKWKPHGRLPFFQAVSPKPLQVFQSQPCD